MTAPENMSSNYYDTYGIATGINSSYKQAYAARQNLLLFTGSQTTTDNNMGNDFKEFERMQGEILKVQIRDMLINLFRYTNLPPTLNAAQLETMLRSVGGGVCIGLDDQNDLVILDRSDDLAYNLYGQVIPSFMDGKSFLRDKRVITNRNLDGDFVVFYNKQSYLDFYSTDFQIVDHYAKMLATIKATERMNWLQMRAPYVLRGKKNGVNSNIFESKIMSGDLFIPIDENSDIDDKISKLDLNVQDRTPTLQNAYRNTMNEMLTLFGVYNNPEMKKERLTSGESSANNHIIEGMGDIYFNARRNAIDLVNAAFGTSIEVEWNSTVATMFRNMSTKNNGL